MSCRYEPIDIVSYITRLGARIPTDEDIHNVDPKYRHLLMDPDRRTYIMPTTISVSYYTEGRGWNYYVAFREVWQNAADVQCGYKLLCRPDVHFEKNRIIVSNGTAAISIDQATLIGRGEKRETEMAYRGRFGEGLKGAMIAVVATGGSVFVHSAAGFIVTAVPYSIGVDKVVAYVIKVARDNLATRMGRCTVVEILLDERKVNNVRSVYERDLIFENYAKSHGMKIVSASELVGSENSKVLREYLCGVKRCDDIYLALGRPGDERVYSMDIVVGAPWEGSYESIDPIRDTGIVVNLPVDKLEPNRMRLAERNMVSTVVAHLILASPLIDYHLKIRRDGNIVTVEVSRDIAEYIDSSNLIKYIKPYDIVSLVESRTGISVAKDKVDFTLLFNKYVIAVARSEYDIPRIKLELTNMRVNGLIILTNSYQLANYLESKYYTLNKAIAEGRITRPGTELGKLKCYEHGIYKRLSDYFTYIGNEIYRHAFPGRYDITVKICDMPEEGIATAETYGMSVPAQSMIAISRRIVDDVLSSIFKPNRIEYRDGDIIRALSRPLAVLVHELAHIAVEQVYGVKGETHGPTFSKAVDELMESGYFLYYRAKVVFLLYLFNAFDSQCNVLDLYTTYETNLAIIYNEMYGWHNVREVTTLPLIGYITSDYDTRIIYTMSEVANYVFSAVMSDTPLYEMYEQVKDIVRQKLGPRDRASIAAIYCRHGTIERKIEHLTPLK